MIVGHYAAALIPYSRLKESRTPFWLLLLCANVPEFLWLLLALGGIEPASPASMFDASFSRLDVHMTYSHNLVPGLLQGVAVAVLVQLWLRRPEVSLWCGFLAAFHVLCDLVVGFEHQLWDADSVRVSLNTYASAPTLAIAIELVFALTCIYWYQRSEQRRGRPIGRQRLAALYAVFAIGILAWLPAAHHSVNEQLQALGIAL